MRRKPGTPTRAQVLQIRPLFAPEWPPAAPPGAAQPPVHRSLIAALDGLEERALDRRERLLRQVKERRGRNETALPASVRAATIWAWLPPPLAAVPRQPGARTNPRRQARFAFHAIRQSVQTEPNASRRVRPVVRAGGTDAHDGPPCPRRSAIPDAALPALLPATCRAVRSCPRTTCIHDRVIDAPASGSGPSAPSVLNPGGPGARAAQSTPSPSSKSGDDV